MTEKQIDYKALNVWYQKDKETLQNEFRQSPKYDGGFGFHFEMFLIRKFNSNSQVK